MRTMRRKNFNIKKISRDYSFEKEAKCMYSIYLASRDRQIWLQKDEKWLSILKGALNSHHYKLLRIFLLV